MIRKQASHGKQSVISNESQLSVAEDSQYISLRPRNNTMNNGIRHSKSFNDLGDRRTYDVKVGYSKKKKIPPIGQEPKSKARVVTFFRNGDQYFGGIKISIHSERYFKTMGNLQDYLSQRIKIPQGVRYIFTHDGHLIEDIGEFQHGESYVASGVKTFQELDYGSLARLRTAQTAIKPNAAPLRPDDMKLFRPVSPSGEPRIREFRANGVHGIPEHVSSRSSGVTSLPGSRESCVITIVNNYDHALTSRVLLNLRTVQSFEDVLEDMGQSVKLKKATRMMTPWGELVRGFSHLRNDLFEVETFYLDDGVLDTNENVPPPIIRKSRARKPKGRRVKYARSNSAPRISRTPDIFNKAEVLPALRVRIQ